MSKIIFNLRVLIPIFIILLIYFFATIIIKSINKESALQPTRKPSPILKKTPLLIKGSIPYWDQENAFESFKKPVHDFDYINLFWYYIADDGEIQKYNYANEDKNIIDFANKNNVKVLAVITNLPETNGTSWDSKRVEKVIQDSSSRKKHILNIAEKLELLNFDGVNIDYEEVKASQKDRFSLFIRELAEVLHERKKIVSVSLHPKTGDTNESENIGAFQDWKALGKTADHLNIMVYGEHWDEGDAGPIASYSFVEEIIKYAQRLQLPKEKLFLGIPLYGYDWNKDDESKAKGLTYRDVEYLIENYDVKEEWDSYSRSPYFFYQDENGDKHEVWFENAKSVKEKILLAKRYGLAGITFWRLGGEDSSIWNLID